MNARELYIYALGQATAVAEQVPPDNMSLPTPDTEWTVRDLLQHMVYELAWTADIVAGKTLAEVGDKHEYMLFHGSPVKLWNHNVPVVREAVEECNERAIAHLSYADVTVEAYLTEAGNDQLVHAWDLGQAIGMPVVFDEAVARMLYQQALARKDEYANSGLFAAPLSVPDSAPVQTKLLALLGRSSQWASSRV